MQGIGRLEAIMRRWIAGSVLGAILFATAQQASAQLLTFEMQGQVACTGFGLLAIGGLVAIVALRGRRAQVLRIRGNTERT
jgi:hypothetical protein